MRKGRLRVTTQKVLCPEAPLKRAELSWSLRHGVPPCLPGSVSGEAAVAAGPRSALPGCEEHVVV